MSERRFAITGSALSLLEAVFLEAQRAALISSRSARKEASSEDSRLVLGVLSTALRGTTLLGMLLLLLELLEFVGDNRASFL